MPRGWGIYSVRELHVQQLIRCQPAIGSRAGNMQFYISYRILRQLRAGSSRLVFLALCELSAGGHEPGCGEEDDGEELEESGDGVEEGRLVLLFVGEESLCVRTWGFSRRVVGVTFMVFPAVAAKKASFPKHNEAMARSTNRR